MALELYIEDELIDLIGDEQISTDYAIAEIGDFATRKGFRSINFDIPITANNKRILENAEIVNNTTTRPYRRLKARVFVDGIDQNIRFADIESTQETYNVRLYGGNASFFDIIKNKTLPQLSYLPSLDHEFNLTNVYDSRQNNDGYIYPLIDWHADSPNSIMSNTSKTFDVRYCYPCLFVDEIIENICSDAGYSLNNILLNDVNYQTGTLIFPIVDKYDIDYDCEGEQTQSTQPLTQISVFDWIGFALIDDSTTNDLQGQIQTFVNLPMIFNVAAFNQTVDAYLVEAGGSYEVTADINYTNSISSIYSPEVGIYLIAASTGDITFIAGVSAQIGTNLTETLTASFTANENDKIAIFSYSDGGANISSTDLTLNSGTKLSVIAGSVDYKPFNKVVEIDTAISKIKQSDFIKAYLQMFSCLISVDEDTKTVFINKFDEIQDNIPLAFDWSDKIDYTDNNLVEYNLDQYGQSNALIYKQDDSIDDVFIQGANGSLNIDDTTLDADNRFVELPFAATEMDARLEAFVIPKIKIFRTNNSVTTPTDKVQPRILLLERVTTVPSVIYSDGSSTFTTNVDLPLPWFMLGGKQLNLGFGNNLIELYYSGLQDVLNRTKIVTEQIRLNALDIQQLDFLKPVYLSKHNAYFYISKISGFTYGTNESTEVELVKLR